MGIFTVNVNINDIWDYMSKCRPITERASLASAVKKYIDTDKKMEYIREYTSFVVVMSALHGINALDVIVHVKENKFSLIDTVPPDKLKALFDKNSENETILVAVLYGDLDPMKILNYAIGDNKISMFEDLTEVPRNVLKEQGLIIEIENGQVAYDMSKIKGAKLDGKAGIPIVASYFVPDRP